ncbi:MULTISPECIES: hypothetical protein [unclassified Paenibacillus]|uniref:hypothetical protein n=1 Tax=unclassified Paenibacillus TaxID=185978 RepID=UPI000CFC0429|nr:MULTISPECIES: hypothetical protein [unclassified Paenibacillus]PRA04809.1 hypothetical protein CQ043_12160 [Paenibacillus sp. MYb63]PRA47846.1 hypothetical protein CQ061_14670 [Paenibacillus sp. MYb67]
MEFIVNMGKDKANMFLRALWSQIRLNLGKGGWNYQPHKVGSNNLIHFGWLSAEMLKDPLEVSIKYKHKGSIYKISLESSELQEKEELRKKVEVCIQNAMNFETLVNKVNVSSYIKALECPIGTSSGDNFSIHPTDINSLNILGFSVLGFDKVDTDSQAQVTLNKILDVLSVETQSVFFYANHDEKGKLTKIKEIETEDAHWYGTNRPILNGHFTISKKAKLFIDNIIVEENEENKKYLNACRLFHSAHKYNMLRYEHENLNIPEEFRKLILPNEEVAAVLYMSALEVASNSIKEKPKKCELCGNPIYSISSRVIKYVQGFEADDYAVKNFYNDRSIYLHTGGFFSDQSYIGTTIPQLDPSNPSGCKNHIPMKNLLSISDVVSFCLRQQLQQKLLGY